MKRMHRLILLLCLTLLAPRAAWAAGDLTWSQFMLPATIDGQPHQLDTLLVAPNGPGPFPVALIAHGVPRKPEEMPTSSPFAGAVRAEAFARNGYAAYVVMRRGFGRSTGTFSESNVGCDNADYQRAARGSSADLKAALQAIRQRPEADGSTMIVAGLSGGGFGALALAAADPPPGLRAVINFAGGRGSLEDKQCAKDRIIDAFAGFGRNGGLPSLWIYAENDKYFPPPLARRFFDAFTGAGGRGVWAPTPAEGEDGHGMSSRRSGVELWLPAVERFLANNRLPVKRGAGMAVAAHLDAEPPLSLGNKGPEGWAKYLNAPPYSAFAASADGRFWGYATGRRSDDEAQQAALGFCKSDCRVIAVNGRPSLR
jgi:dienelactone hydrolase